MRLLIIMIVLAMAIPSMAGSGLVVGTDKERMAAADQEGASGWGAPEPGIDNPDNDPRGFKDVGGFDPDTGKVFCSTDFLCKNV